MNKITRINPPTKYTGRAPVEMQITALLILSDDDLELIEAAVKEMYTNTMERRDLTVLMPQEEAFNTVRNIMESVAETDDRGALVDVHDAHMLISALVDYIDVATKNGGNWSPKTVEELWEYVFGAATKLLALSTPNGM